LHSSALQVLVIASSTVILARFADLIALNDKPAVKSILIKAGLASAIVGVLGVFMVWALGATTLEWLFGGRFDAAAADRVSNHWLLLTLAVPFSMLGNVFAKLFQAKKQPIMMSSMAFSSLPALYLSYAMLNPIAGELSIAVAIAISSAISLLTAIFLYKPKNFTS
jgi:peptidoglycan biosynthesis protein MviN/MurJ (putative lipid II flippase)